MRKTGNGCVFAHVCTCRCAQTQKDCLCIWRAAGLENTAIEDATGSYAYHIPEGILLIWDPTEQRAQSVDEVIPTHSIAPALLQALDVVPPDHMGL